MAELRNQLNGMPTAKTYLRRIAYRLPRDDAMTDQQTTLRAVSNALRVLEEYLEPRPHDNERLLNRLVEVLDRNEVVTALSRLEQGYTL
jgi:hypothetical protein